MKKKENLNNNKKKLECYLSHEPNVKTIQAIEDIKNRKNIKASKSIEELFKELGIEC